MKDLLSKAGIQITEASRLLQVSRATVSSWVNNNSEPHRFLKDRVDRFIFIVDAAVANADLPISEDVDKAERLSKISKVLSAYEDSNGYAGVIAKH